MTIYNDQKTTIELLMLEGIIAIPTGTNGPTEVDKKLGGSEISIMRHTQNN